MAGAAPQPQASPVAVELGSSGMGWERITALALGGLALALPLSVAAAHIFLGLLIVLFAFGWRRQPLRRTPLDRPVLLFLAVSVVAAVFGTNPLNSFRALAPTWHISIYLLVVNLALAEAQARRVAALALGVATLNALYGVAQRALGGLDLFRSTGHELIMRVGTDVRATGVFDHFMTFAGQMLLAALLAIGLALSVPERRERRLLWGCAAVIVFGLLASFTRSAWLGFGVGLALVTRLCGRRLFWRAGAAMAVAVLILVAVSPGVRTRVTSIANVSTDWSNTERLRMWQTALEIAREHPLLGVGDGGFRAAMEPYRGAVGALSHSHPHDEFLAQLTTKGVLGLAAYLYIWVAFFRAVLPAVALAAGFERGLLIGGAGALAGFQVAGLFESNFGDSEVAMLMWFVVGMALWAERRVTGR